MVVKSATKKKLMDIGIQEEYAHKLADDKKWADIKKLTVIEIKAIIGCGNFLADDIKGIIESASLPEIDDYIKEMFQNAVDSILNPDTGEEKEALESLDQSPYGTLFNEEFVITLKPVQVKFLDMYDQEGPDDEHFEDPSWDHCGNHNCEPCIIHALHHGINGEAKSIWQQCFEKFGDKDS